MLELVHEASRAAREQPRRVAVTSEPRPCRHVPEQHLGEEVDARTDVYALGVLAYETLTGALPLRGRPSCPRIFLAELLATAAAIAPTEAVAPRRRVLAPTLPATVFMPPAPVAFARPCDAEPRRPRRKAGFRRWIFRAVIAAAAITGGAIALDVDARNPREVLDRLDLAVDAIDLTIREHT